MEKYNTTKVLNKGQYSKVKLAEDINTGEEYAIKTIRVPDDDSEYEDGMQVVDLVGDDYDSDDEQDDDDESSDEENAGQSTGLVVLVEENTSKSNYMEHIRTKSEGSEQTVTEEASDPKLNHLMTLINKLKKQQTESLSERIQHEVMALNKIKNIDHPDSQYLIGVKEVIEDSIKQKIYIVFEYAKGGDLLSFIENQNKLSEDVAKRYFVQIVRGLSLLHNSGICHRDLKPENILLYENTIKITDFGFCGMFKKNNPMFNSLCGTENYVAPEVLEQEAEYDGIKSDVWSLGCILFTMASGLFAFDDESHPKLIKSIIDVDYKMPNHFSPLLKDLLSSVLVKDPNQRLSLDDILTHGWVVKE
ncbi:hypothetical protein AKO1_015830 [Acrasis kona]|uniref:Protein kinase domain-containing protein n=1 Tax=Acrasis kona TaxID=1008807 RepID=A0AAW2ZHF5_9EUKA